MKSGLRILLTNNQLATRAGSEMFLYEVAIGLMKRGHNPVAYSMNLGEVAADLRRRTIPVIDSLEALAEPPDVIHGQHHLEAVTAMLRFPAVPVIYYCHGWLPWQERPAVFPSIKNYIAVDDLCRERLLTTPGIRPDQVRTMYNFVDLDRFQPRQPLPDRPASALIFSNHASEKNYAGVIRAACQHVGIEKVDILGIQSGATSSEPETILPGYDIIFAKGRCALEAMASGCATVVTESHGVGGLVTMQNVAALRKFNFGVRTMQSAPLSEETLIAALQQYDPGDAGKVSEWIRGHAGFQPYLDSLEQLYQHAYENRTKETATLQAALTAASNYLCSLGPLVKQQARDARRAENLEKRCQMLQQQIEKLTATK